ncbi:MAG: phosphatase PAP2 family protein [Ilumatobacteraceae bacterium]
MPWPTWDQAALLAVACVLTIAALRRLRPGRLVDAVIPAARELGIIAALYSIWRVARKLPFTHEAGAIGRARDIVRIQTWLHVPTELSLQRFVLRHDELARSINSYYAIVHVPALLAFLVWLYVRHRDRFPHWRNGLAGLTAGCLFIRFVRVAPPRFVTDLGYIDLADRYGLSVYGPVGTGVSDQFAAMPSIHVGWAAVVACGVVVCSSSRSRWVVALHLPVTMLVVSATGHHWWLDGVVAIALLAVALRADAAVRARRSPRPTSSGRTAVSEATGIAADTTTG